MASNATGMDSASNSPATLTTQVSERDDMYYFDYGVLEVQFPFSVISGEADCLVICKRFTG